MPTKITVAITVSSTHYLIGKMMMWVPALESEGLLLGQTIYLFFAIYQILISDIYIFFVIYAFLFSDNFFFGPFMFYYFFIYQFIANDNILMCLFA